MQAVDFSTPNLDTLSEFVLNRNVPRVANEYSHVFLFNNAGSLGKLDRLCNQKCVDIKSNLDVNLLAPMVFSCKFLKLYQSCPHVSIINISSLAAIQPFDTWGVYSSIKAARDMFHRNIAIEHSLIDDSSIHF